MNTTIPVNRVYTSFADWSIRRGIVTSKGEVYRSLIDWLDAQPDNANVCLEATFGSFRVEEHNDAIDHAAKRGITLWTTPTRLTGKARRHIGLFKDHAHQKVDTDIADAQAIEWGVTNGKIPVRKARKWSWEVIEGTRVMHPQDSELMGYVMVAKGRLMTLRAESLKAAYAENLASQLPPLLDQPETVQKALGHKCTGRKPNKVLEYNPTAVAAVAVVAELGLSWNKARRVLGLTGHGVRSQMRADLEHWVWSGGSKRAKLTGEPVIVNGKEDGYAYRARKDGLTHGDFDKAIRWLYRQLLDLQSYQPVS